MFLNKLYCEPAGLFKPVKFKNGINFIFGKKDNATDAKKSLNGIGKSSLLDLLDFCMLCDFSKKNPRLNSEEKRLSNYNIVLDFEINNHYYTIKRNVKKPNEIKIVDGNQKTVYELDDCKQFLCDLIFKDDNYKGKYSNRWFRRLMPFFIKIQKHEKPDFVNPVQYIKEIKVMELNIYHFLLLGINNDILSKICELKTHLKARIKTVKEIEKLINETYQIDDIPEASSKINKIVSEINKLEQSIDTFKLVDSYEDAEKAANEFTATIKGLFQQNNKDKKTIDNYRESFKIDNVKIETDKIQKIYKQFNQLLGDNVKTTLDDAIVFRKNIAVSRKEFLKDEIDNLFAIIKERKHKIKELDNKRQSLFSFLSNKEAISDLTEAFHNISEKKKVVSDLRAKVELYNDLEKEVLELENAENLLKQQLLHFLKEIKYMEIDFSSFFEKIYNEIYQEAKGLDKFYFKNSFRKDCKLEIIIDIPDKFSKGKNQGRTLLYDIAVLLNAIDKNIKMPHFLVHDGIFDSMDKAHFVQLYSYLTKLAEKEKFQYILTINEEGTLTDNFGDDFDKVSAESIANEAIAVFTPTNKFYDFNSSEFE